MSPPRGCHPALFYLSDLVSPLFFVNMPTIFFASGVNRWSVSPGAVRPPLPPVTPLPFVITLSGMTFPGNFCGLLIVSPYLISLISVHHTHHHQFYHPPFLIFSTQGPKLVLPYILPAIQFSYLFNHPTDSTDSSCFSVFSRAHRLIVASVCCWPPLASFRVHIK